MRMHGRMRLPTIAGETGRPEADEFSKLLDFVEDFNEANPPPAHTAPTPRHAAPRCNTPHCGTAGPRQVVNELGPAPIEIHEDADALGSPKKNSIHVPAHAHMHARRLAAHAEFAHEDKRRGVSRRCHSTCLYISIHVPMHMHIEGMLPVIDAIAYAFACTLACSRTRTCTCTHTYSRAAQSVCMHAQHVCACAGACVAAVSVGDKGWEAGAQGVHARTHARTLARSLACKHACMHACTHARSLACMHACTHARMHACTGGTVDCRAPRGAEGGKLTMAGRVE